ncbi:MAG: transketolase, partial [Anaerolineaceae bacterium]|nr:transketolase [Anaerolineaceae bacterium]
GPTHQPIEQIASLRLIPGLNVIRPADANEVLESWKFAVSHRLEPTALILSRQNLQTFDRHLVAPASGLNKGAYVLKDFGDNLPNLLLMATGSELSLAFSAASLLASEGINVRVVSFPCWELFEKQDESYKDEVLLPSVQNRIAIEAGVTAGWEKWVGDKGIIIGINEFGASGPANVVMQEFGFSVNNIVDQASRLNKKNQDK